jgi:hypothetical protein
MGRRTCRTDLLNHFYDFILHCSTKCLYNDYYVRLLRKHQRERVQKNAIIKVKLRKKSILKEFVEH